MRNTKIQARKGMLKNGQVIWQGALRVYENGRYLWAQLSPIKRLTKEDASRDAADLQLNYAWVN